MSFSKMQSNVRKDLKIVNYQTIYTIKAKKTDYKNFFEKFSKKLLTNDSLRDILMTTRRGRKRKGEGSPGDEGFESEKRRYGPMGTG
ncbi:MAG: hypothetical protein LUI02_02635 [Clostridiales bacterium]|nr:hypothetical protein [Clostridiales bacterium]